MQTCQVVLMEFVGKFRRKYSRYVVLLADGTTLNKTSGEPMKFWFEQNARNYAASCNYQCTN